MSRVIENALILHKRATTAYLNANDPVLSPGETIMEVDTGRTKTGPRTGGNWASLPYDDEPDRTYVRGFAFPRNPRKVLMSDYVQAGDNGDAALAINRAVATLPFGTKYSTGWKNTRIIGGAGVVVIDQDCVIKSPVYYRHNMAVECVTPQTLVDFQGPTARFERMTLATGQNSYDLSGLAFINGVYYSSTGDAPSAFYLLRVVDSYFENVTVKGFASHGIQADQCQWVTFHNVKSWRNGGYGFSLGYSVDDATRGNDVSFTGSCEAAENNQGGVYWVGQRHKWLGGDIQFNRRLIQADASIVGSTATVTTSAAHNLAVGDQVSIENLTGTLAGAALAGPMFVQAVPTSTTFTLSERIGGVVAAALTGTGTAQVTKYAPGLVIDGPDSIGCTADAHFEGNSTHVVVKATNPTTPSGQPRGNTLISPIFVISRHMRKFIENQGLATTIVNPSYQNDAASLYGYKDTGGTQRKAPFQLWSTGTAFILGGPGLTGETNLVCNENGDVASTTGWAGGGLYANGGIQFADRATGTVRGVLTNGASSPMLSINGSNRLLVGATNQGTNVQASNLRFFDANTGATQIARIGQLTDNTGGTASATLAAITDAATRNAVASLAAKVNAIEAQISGLGLTQ